MITDKHQFHNKDFYVPNWDIKFLFIGTYNPSGGDTVPYYYGRKTNRHWKLLSEVFNIDFNVHNESFFKDIKNHKIGCIDLIHSVTFEQEFKELITGKGYNDNELFRKRHIKSYHTDEIINVIRKNNLNKVYFTRTRNGFQNEQKVELQKIENICEVVYLSSPSPANRDRANTLKSYKENIK
jgi:G:T/U-mismatch repair DNA glycosylase|tara:strand:+ start:718 stop:1263 length:546 start_codon:yes stop_codon:yes gene_type:complete